MTYQWNGTFWLPVGGSTALYIGDTPPALPATGQLWFKSDEARLYVYYNDGNSTQWVPAAPIPGTQTIPPLALLQTRSVQVGAMSTTTAVIPYDDTVPQNNEGTEFMTLAITPISASSKLIIEVVANVFVSATTGVLGALFQDANVNALSTAWTYLPGASTRGQLAFNYVLNPSGTTSPTTFRVRLGPDNPATLTFNGSSGARLFGGTFASGIIIQEVAA